MPKEFSRARRMAEQIQRELSEVIQSELKDPRVGLVTLTAVEVSRDYSHAKIYFTLLGDVGLAGPTLTVLERAAGFLRRQLAQRMQTRTVPQLHFLYDTSVERGVRLSQLIDAAVGSGKEPPAEDES